MEHCLTVFGFVFVLASLNSCCAAIDIGPTSGIDGDVVISGNTVVNDYFSVASINTTSNMMSLTTTAGVMSEGNLVLLYQAQGATLSWTDTASYGTVRSYGGAGKWQFNIVSSVMGNNITLVHCLDFPFEAEHVQLIRIPQYSNLTVTLDGRLSAKPWDGATGGVVALHVAGSLYIAFLFNALFFLRVNLHVGRGRCSSERRHC